MFVFRGIKIEMSHPCHQIHIPCSYEQPAFSAGVDLPAKVKDNDDNSGKITLEESFGTWLGADRL